MNTIPRRALRAVLWTGLSLFALGAAPVLQCAQASTGTSAPKVRKLREENFPAPILAFDLSASSNLAAAALSDGRVRVWHLETGEIVHDFIFPLPDSELRDRDEVEPIRVRFSPDGMTLAISHLSSIFIYDTKDWLRVAVLGLQGEDNVRPRSLPTLAQRPVCEEHYTPKEMAEKYEMRITRGDGATRVTDFAFTPGGVSALAAYCRGACYEKRWRGGNFVWPSGKDPVRLWRVSDGRLLWERYYAPEAVIERVATSPDGRLFAAASSQPGWHTVRIYDVKSGAQLWSLPRVGIVPGKPPSVLFTPDAGQLITFSAVPGNRKGRRWEHFAVYESRDGAKVADLPGGIGESNADISPDGHWLAAPTESAITFKIYDFHTRQVVMVERWHFPWGWTGPDVDRVRFDPTGRYLVVANRLEGKLAVYRIQ